MGNRSGVCFKCVQHFLHHLTLPWKNQDNVLIFQSGMKRFKTFFFFLHFSGAHNTSRAMCSPWFCCCFFFFASGSFKSVQAGVFIKPSQLTQSYSFSPLSSSNRLPFSPCHQLVIRAASHHTEEHSSKDPEGTSQPPFFPTKSASETTDRRLLGHLSALRAGGGPQHILLRDQKDLCHATQLKSEARTEGPMPFKSDQIKSVGVGAHTWHRGSGRGLTGAGAFLASVQPRQEGNNGLKRRPRPFRKTLLERL